MYQIAYIVCLLVLTAVMIPISIYDVRTHTIKNKVVLAILCTSPLPIVFDTLSPEKAVGWMVAGHLAGGVLAFVLMCAVGLYVKGGLGGGDIKLLGAIGLWFNVYYALGVAAGSALFYLAYCVFTEIKYAKQGREKPKTLAFGPCVGVAVLVASVIQIVIILI